MTDSYYPPLDSSHFGGLAPVGAGPSPYGGISAALPKKRLGVWSFWLLALICLSSINSLRFVDIGIGRLFTIPTLILCLVCLTAFQWNFWRALGTPGRVLFACLATYLLISSRLGIGIPPSRLFFRVAETRGVTVTDYLSSFLVIAAAAVGARHVLLTWPLQRTMRLLYFLSLLSVATIVLGAIWPGFYNYTVESRFGRQFGLFGNANRAGIAACMAALLGFACLITDKRKVLIIAGIFLCAAAVILTYSRSSILVFALVVFCQILISPVFKRKSLLIAVLIVAAGAAWLFVHMLSSTHFQDERQKARLESIINIAHGKIRKEDMGARPEIAAVGLAHCLQRPVAGNGFGFMNAMPDAPRRLGAHNTFLLLWGEAGFVPPLLLLASLALLARQAWKCRSPTLRAFVLGFALLFFCACMVGHGYLKVRTHNVMLGVCFGLMAGARIAERVETRARRFRSV